MAARTTYTRQQQDRQKKMEEWLKDREKQARKSKKPLPEEENPYEFTWLEVAVKPSGGIDPNQNATFTFSEPIARVDTTKLHFCQKVDSTLVEVPYLFLPDEVNPRVYTLYAEWEPKATYQLTCDSLAFTGPGGGALPLPAR